MIYVTEYMNCLSSQVYSNELLFNEPHIEHNKNYIGIEEVNKPYQM